MTKLAGKFKSSVRSLICTPLNSLLNRIDPPVIVLLYHRVTALASDPEMLAVTPDNFRKQMQYLKETVPLVKFDEDWSQLLKPAVAVTFDDGYADNALEALPILEEVGIPATFFVSTGGIGSGEEFWWHELERIFLEERNLPSSLTLEDPTFKKSWMTSDVKGRQDCYQDLVHLMKETDAELRDAWFVQLRCWAKAERTDSDAHRVMTIDELRLLGQSKLVTMGAHTVSHMRLSSLSTEAQREEITDSKKQLEAWLGTNISTFSYPFGRCSDYTKESIALCREAGFTKVAANFPGQAHRWTDLYQIPRHLVRNWPVEAFAAKLREFWTR